MAEGNWGHGGQAQPDTGINQLLATYASRGGELLGARRWAENPLTLTHVRWQDGSGYVLEAIRRPDIDLYLSEAERNIWVQLALHFPMAQATTIGSSAPWLPLTLQPAEAADLVNTLQRSQSGGESSALTGGLPGGRWQANPPATPPEALNTGRAFQPPQPPRQAQQSGVNSWSPRESAPSGPFIPPRGGAEAPGTWNSYGEAPEVSAIPCVEIELPPLLAEATAAEAAREFTKDVAAHFKRAAFSIPQTREVRGWMHTGRLVLAARVVVAMGTRAPSHSEMEHTAHLLADELARRTIPYTRMVFADPGEWAQGVALPD
jgi:hypothetical protein